MTDRERIIADKSTILFRKDTLSAIAALDDGACAEFIRACLDYDTGEIIKEHFEHETARALFTLARPQLDEAMQQYITGRQQRIDAANRRWKKDT